MHKVFAPGRIELRSIEEHTPRSQANTIRPTKVDKTEIEWGSRHCCSFKWTRGMGEDWRSNV